MEEAPRNSKVIFSAHGVSKKVKQASKLYNQLTIDATCPLHKGHPEVDGIEGQVNQNIIIIENEAQAKRLKIKEKTKVAYVTQTTLSLNDTSAIINILKRKIPTIVGPNLDDICYATQNRQVAVSKLADLSDLVFVVGGENSSNTNRLAEIARKKSIPVYRISGKRDIQKKWLDGIKTLGITSGASSPEVLIDEILELLRSIYYKVQVENLNGIEENIKFKPLKKFS